MKSMVALTISSTENNLVVKPWLTGFRNSILYVFSFLLAFITSPRMTYLFLGVFFLVGCSFFPYLMETSSAFLHCEKCLLLLLHPNALSQNFLLAFFTLSLSSSIRLWRSCTRFLNDCITLCTMEPFSVLTGTPYLTRSFNFLQ